MDVTHCFPQPFQGAFRVGLRLACQLHGSLVIGGCRLQHPKTHDDGDEFLLGSVVQIAFDSLSLNLEGGGQGRPAAAELLKFRQQV
ncbi:hypothetical protein SRO_0229 [Streptomyces rochei]|nr:hypothetical protein SRO_0229 [Streptomyces rochei]